ncbi:MAG: succinylglutamate desuccinylase/aspartoacylase family protein [Deltaproteobacteria bacterium]|nr:succinylglutamate desuccinylase/aspartoacylase family protein [Deltaproteobacteria bacterium]
MKQLRTCVLVFLLFICCARSFSSTNYSYFRIPIALLTKQFVQSTGFIRDHKWDDTYAFGYISIEKVRALPQAVQPYTIELDALDWAQNDYDPKTLQVRNLAISSSASYEAYHTYETLTEELRNLAEAYPNLATLNTAGKSVEGRQLWYLRISSQSKSIAKPKLLYISSMHGDEVVGKELMVYLARELLSSYGTDDRITRLVDYGDIFVMPSMNPDGTAQKQRFNSHGADLNRSFPFLSSRNESESYEPEIQAIMDLHRKIHFLVALNFHGGSLCMNIPWDSHPNQTAEQLFGDDPVMRWMARNYADRNKPMYNVHYANFVHGVTYGFEWYQILGGMQDWASHYEQSIHATAEVSNVKWPQASTLPTFWQDNKDSLLQYLEDGLMGVHLRVTDTHGNLLPVNVKVDSLRRSLKYSGIVHRVTAAGLQRVTIEAKGYQMKILDLPAALFVGSFHDITLEPEK